MADQLFPDGIGRRSESWWIENPSASSGPSATGNQQFIASPAGRWRARTTLLVRNAADLLELRGFLASLDGPANATLVGPRDLTGQPVAAYTLAADAAVGDTQITLRRTVAETLVRGPYLALGSDMLTIVGLPTADNGAPGDVMVQVRPWLRISRAAGTAVITTNPRARMRLDPQSIAAIERVARSPRSEVQIEMIQAV